MEAVEPDHDVQRVQVRLEDGGVAVDDLLQNRGEVALRAVVMEGVHLQLEVLVLLRDER